ncbi:MAG TPA: SEC-C metal-binding domain-containing protein [Bryobacteraceae bacterium]|nr:SEC-C metal-binding domain-containing protein [Bryobacteraceae bacterium]
MYRLLEAAAHGYVGVDHRFLHALVDQPQRAIPDLLRFAAEDREQDPVDLEAVLLNVFRHLRTPEAMPFYVDRIRRNPLTVPDELVEAVAPLGAGALEPLLGLMQDLGEQDPGDVPFILASLGVRDERIFQTLIGLLDKDVLGAALCLEIYGDRAAIPALEVALSRCPADDRTRSLIESAIRILSLPLSLPGYVEEPFDIWEQYPDKESPEFDLLSEQDRLAMLGSDSAELRAEAAASYASSDIPDKARAKLLEMAKTDPDTKVRGAGWQTLGEISQEPEIRRAMLALIANQEASLEERAGAVVGLAKSSDDPVVFRAIEGLYQDPLGRAMALKAMARSLDRRFAAYPPRHLDDPDPEILGQAIWAAGYLNLSAEAPRLEKFFDHAKLRGPALFAYALAVPGETSRGRARALLRKIEQVADGFDQDEADLVRLALDQRLMLRGYEPVFFSEESGGDEEDENRPNTSAPVEVGRNDPCPCGSGKKFKKCCGA